VSGYSPGRFPDTGEDVDDELRESRASTPRALAISEKSGGAAPLLAAAAASLANGDGK
jgi:hypothetical protein